MTEILFLILLPLSAGMIGFFLKEVPSKIYKLILALSGAFVLAMCFLHLLPHVYEVIGSNYANGHLLVGGALLGGFLLQIGLEWLTGGIEHGHSHAHAGHQFPISLLIGLCVHAFIEGLPLYDHGHEHSHLLISVLVHKFPVALILVLVFKSYNLSNIKSWIYLLIFTFMAPLGILVSNFFAHSIQNIADVMMFITAAVIGVLLHISTTILFEADEDHKFNATKMVMILIGFIIAFFTSM